MKLIILENLIAIIITFFLFSGNNSVVDKDFEIYGKYKYQSAAVDRFEVPCNWDKINPKIENFNFEEYGLYPNFGDSKWSTRSHLEREEGLNVIWFDNYSQNDKKVNSDTFVGMNISFGAQRRSSRYWLTEQGIEEIFSEPMIELYFNNKQALKKYRDSKKGLEPNYELGYRVVYSLDGELALEEGKWFLDEDKDKFCRKYLDIMLKAIGNDN